MKSKYHNEALNIAEMFPDTPFEELLGAFELSNGDLDSTLAYLFNKSSATSTTTTTSTSSDKDEEPLDKKPKEKPQEPQDLIKFDDFKPLITTSTSKPVPDISLLDLALDESPSLPDSEPSDDPELEESISVIGELFPDVPRSVVRITLERCDNDVNQTLDLLLYEKTRSNFNLSGELPDFDSFNNDSSDMSNQEGLDDMNNFFGEILGSNSRNEVDESNFFTLEELEQLKIDQQFAEQLNQLEKEANLKIEQRELEDRKLALSLASQQHTNNLQLEDDELLARKLADEEAAQELAEKEKREYQQLKRIRELEDEALAKELSEKDSQELKKLKEIQLKDMELAKQLENMEKDEEIAKELQAKEDKERKRLQEEEDRKTQELINKLNNPEDPTSVIDHNDREYLKEFSKELGKFKLKQLLGGNCKVEKVWRSDLAENFEAKWTQLKSKYHFDPILTKAEIAFHGTREGNIPNIVRNGLIVPGNHGVTHATDSGWFGKGIYLSPDPNYSVGYCAGGGKLLVCAVLMGKRFVCPNVMHGCSLKSGFDSHTSPDGKEFVLFSSSHVLPLFVIHFKDVNTNYNYDDYNYYIPPVVPMIKHPPPPPATTWWSGLMKQHKEPHKKWQGKKKR